MTDVLAIAALATLFVLFGMFVRAATGCGGPERCTRETTKPGCGGCAARHRPKEFDHE